MINTRKGNPVATTRLPVFLSTLGSKRLFGFTVATSNDGLVLFDV
jgi:hypothetical protein